MSKYYSDRGRIAVYYYIYEKNRDAEASSLYPITLGIRLKFTPTQFESTVGYDSYQHNQLYDFCQTILNLYFYKWMI